MIERRTTTLPSHGLAVFVIVLLLAQYAPLHEVAGGGPNHHCPACTENYCTRDRCFCEHEHRHDRSESLSEYAMPSDAALHTRHHQHEPGSAGEMAEHHGHATRSMTDSESPAVARASHTTPAPPRNVAIRPCSSDNPLGVPVIQVDHFLLGDAHTGGIPAADRPRFIRPSVTARPQTVGDDVFHPPADLG